MNILDENIIAPERERLRAWRIHFRRIGVEVGRLGIQDRDEIIPLLHHLRRLTFFTGDHDFYHPRLRHPKYWLVNPQECAKIKMRLNVARKLIWL